MSGSIAYFDTSFLVRLYWNDPGYAVIREAARNLDEIVCSLHGRAEVVAAIHRKLREKSATPDQVHEIVQQFQTDCAEGGIRWLPLNEAIVEVVEEVYWRAPAELFLRSADALHLACAKVNGLPEIYSNDRHLVAAAPHFGLRAVNLLA